MSAPGTPKPKHLGPDYGSQWQDAEMARVYPCRPPYPAEAYERLVQLIDEDGPSTALDVGAGTGDLARTLALRVERVDAVEPSAAMIAVGKTLEGGEAANLRWIRSPIETATLEGPYGLAVAGESIHWTNWDLSFPAIRDALAPGAVLAIVTRRTARLPWSDALGLLIARYSTNRDYEPYVIEDELVARGHFEVLGRARTDDVPFAQGRDDYVDAIHSRNGFSRARMGVASKVFDAKFRDLLHAHGVEDTIELVTWAELVWGRIP